MQATVLLNFDGLSAADTVASGGPFVPPDTNGPRALPNSWNGSTSRSKCSTRAQAPS